MYREYRVQGKDRKPLIDFMVRALEACKCQVLRASEPSKAPFRLTFETPLGERMGIVAYAFLANQKVTKNRPVDEHRFQIKYGSKDGAEHEIWQDPYGLYTTLFLGINPERGFFVGADPEIHNPTRFFISLEFKERDVGEILSRQWYSWERERMRRHGFDDPIEVLVGGTPESFLRYIRFERAARRLDPGHRQLLAEKGDELLVHAAPAEMIHEVLGVGSFHEMTKEFGLSEKEILDLIESAPRLKMAVRGWVAEEQLVRQLKKIEKVECERIEKEGRPDVWVRYRGGPPLEIECKNILRRRLKDGAYRLDFQKTRHSKDDPCTRYYASKDFDLVAACLHPCTETWSFRYALTSRLDEHDRCVGKLDHRVRIYEQDERWLQEAERALALASEGV